MLQLLVLMPVRDVVELSALACLGVRDSDRSCARPALAVADEPFALRGEDVEGVCHGETGGGRSHVAGSTTQGTAVVRQSPSNDLPAERSKVSQGILVSALVATTLR